MLRVKQGDITTVTEGLILHQVNCQGVMGSGVALAIRNKWPEVYDAYKHTCDNSSKGLLGTIQIVTVKPELRVVNMFGQLWYGRDKNVRYTSYDALDECLHSLGELMRTSLGGRHVHYPMFGSGLGNGNWNAIQCLIQQHIGDFEQTLWLR